MANDNRSATVDLETTRRRRRAASDVFAAIGNDTRYRVLLILRESDEAVCVSAIERHLAVSQSTVSQSLRRLRASGLVSREKRGQRRYYESTSLTEDLIGALEESEPGAGQD